MTELSNAAQQFPGIRHPPHRRARRRRSRPDLARRPAIRRPTSFRGTTCESITAQILARHDGNTLQYGATRGYRPLIEHLLAQHAEGARHRGALRRRDHHQRIAAGPRPGRPRADRSGRSGDRRAADLQRRDRRVSQPAGVARRRAAGRRRHRHRGARSRRDRPGEAGQAGEVRLRHAELPESGRPADERARGAARCSRRRGGTTW